MASTRLIPLFSPLFRPLFRPRVGPLSRRRHGFTLIEVLFAATISAVVAGGLISVNILAQRFLNDGFREVQLTTQAQGAIDTVTRCINSAYRLDATDPTMVFAIQSSNTCFEYSIPDAAGAVQRERIRYDSTGKQLYHERRNSGGTFVNVTTKPLLKNVDKFSIDNQEGIISFVVRVKYSIARYKDKQFTLIGRALPRNI